MHLLRKVVLVLITPIFILLLFATTLDMGVLRIVNNPGNIKQIIADSGIYKTAINDLLSQGGKIDDSSDNAGTISLSNPTVKAAANTTFSPQFIQSNAESVINNVYSWLDGKIPQPNFSIDLTNAKAQFASTVSQAVATRAAELPACTAANIPSDFEAIDATCLPPGQTPAAAAVEVQGDILGGTGFLDNPIINAGTIRIDGSSQSVFSDQLKSLPKQYHRVKESPIILSVATFLVAVAIVFISSTRRRGLRHVGAILLVTGLLMLAFAWGLNYGATQKLLPKLSIDNNKILQTDVRLIITDLEQKIDKNYWLFGGVYAGLGVLAIAAGLLWGEPKGKAKLAANKKLDSDNDNESSDDIAAEGKTDDDRIDLKEEDKVTDLAPEKEPPAKKTGKKKVNVIVQ